MEREDLVKVRMLGAFRSGTNYVRTVLEWNYNCHVLNDSIIWKHSIFPVFSKEAFPHLEESGCIVVVKNPFSCLVSWWKYFSSNPKNGSISKDWESYLRSKIVVWNGGIAKSPEFRFGSPVEFWNDINWNLSSIKMNRAKYRVVLVRYEDILNEPEVFSSKVADMFSFSRKDDQPFRTPEKKLKNMGNKRVANAADYLTRQSFDKKYMLEGGYMQQFSQKDVDYVMSVLDKDLVSKLGYDDIIKDMVTFKREKLTVAAS